ANTSILCMLDTRNKQRRSKMTSNNDMDVDTKHRSSTFQVVLHSSSMQQNEEKKIDESCKFDDNSCLEISGHFAVDVNEQQLTQLAHNFNDVKDGQIEQKENQDGKYIVRQPRTKKKQCESNAEIIGRLSKTKDVVKILKDNDIQIGYSMVKVEPFDKGKSRQKSHFKQCRKCYRLNHIVRIGKSRSGKMPTRMTQATQMCIMSKAAPKRCIAMYDSYQIDKE
ncbi:hypothetical protein RFI_39070, partial [Reticulomyxa filosa]